MATHVLHIHSTGGSTSEAIHPAKSLEFKTKEAMNEAVEQFNKLVETRGGYADDWYFRPETYDSVEVYETGMEAVYDTVLTSRYPGWYDFLGEEGEFCAEPGEPTEDEIKAEINRILSS